MWVRDEICAGIKMLAVDAFEMPTADIESHLQRLERSYTNRGSAPLWERLKESSGFQDSEGWTRIAEYADGATILLVIDAQGICGFRFAKAEDIPRLLAECYGFEFYVFDDAGRYLLVFNHHDFLIGAGDALSWVASLEPR